ncbi:MAG: glycosyltransferase family 39 protein [Bacteroidetes bacterium]|nr:glycosyltransferase family 39 protein [Bacteroidota bacterium]
MADDNPGVFSFRRRRVVLFALMVCLLIVFMVRYNYGRYIPLSGDEVGVGVLQSVGKWSLYKTTLPCNEKTDIAAIKQFITYSDEKSAIDVIATMRSDRLHPPLYFIILHFVIKYFGTTVAVLRTLSIIFSIFSVITIFYLGKVLFNESVGLVSAFFMALSPYCLEYSVMVRLYPLAMWLSVLSTLLVVTLVKRKAFHFRSVLLYVYIFTCVAGLYTYYSFAVLIASQFVFVMLSEKRDLRTVINVILTYSVIVLLLIPWLIPMLQGVNAVQTQDYYFKGSYTIVVLLQYFFTILFIPFRDQLSSINPVIAAAGMIFLSLFIMIIFLLGVYKSASSRIVISFLFSVFLYFFIFIASDTLMHTKVMVFDRQHYFAVPVLLLLLASGVVYITRKMFLKRMILLFFTILFLTGFIYRYLHQSVFDGPYYFHQLTQQLNLHSLNTKDDENLILFNAKDKRYLLPFAHNSTRNFDLMIIPDGITGTILERIDKNEKYKNIFLVNIDVPEDKRKRMNMQSISVNKVSLYLHDEGYTESAKPYVFQYVETLTINKYFRH